MTYSYRPSVRKGVVTTWLMLTAGMITVLPNENTSSTCEQNASNVQESSGGHENVPERSEKDSTSEKGRVSGPSM